MITLKKIFKKLFLLPNKLILIFVPLAATLLTYVFKYEHVAPSVQYFAYFFSAYVLVASCTHIPNLIKSTITFLNKNKYTRIYLSDSSLRIKISLYISLIINVAYSLMQFYLGLVNKSLWFYAFAIYYFCLGFMRFFLLKHTRKEQLGKNQIKELLYYRLCGVIMLLLNFSLSIISGYIVVVNKGFNYHYIITIAMATYTFTVFGKSISDMVRYRKFNSPVASASKEINFAVSLVSILSLETAMLNSFGNGNTEFNTKITLLTSIVVSICILNISLHMIISSTKKLRGIYATLNN